MVRQTSVDSFNLIKNNGLLSKKRWDVYQTLYEHGPATGMELLKFFPKDSVDSQIRARLNELRSLGVAHEVCERICTVTGMTVIEWDVTSLLPAKTGKVKKTKCEHCSGKGYTETV